MRTIGNPSFLSYLLRFCYISFCQIPYPCLALLFSPLLFYLPLTRFVPNVEAGYGEIMPFYFFSASERAYCLEKGSSQTT